MIKRHFEVSIKCRDSFVAPSSFEAPRPPFSFSSLLAVHLADVAAQFCSYKGLRAVLKMSKPRTEELLKR